MPPLLTFVRAILFILGVALANKIMLLLLLLLLMMMMKYVYIFSALWSG